MTKKKAKKKHSVKVNLQVFELSKTGTSLELKITSDNQKIGDLTIGRGSIFWHGSNRQSKKRISWSRFAKMMNELAYG